MSMSVRAFVKLSILGVYGAEKKIEYLWACQTFLVVEYLKFFARKRKQVNKDHDQPLSLFLLLASTADTCKQTQNPQRRTTTNRKRSAGSPSQPRTNEEQAHRCLACCLSSSGCPCSVLRREKRPSALVPTFLF